MFTGCDKLFTCTIMWTHSYSQAYKFEQNNKEFLQISKGFTKLWELLFEVLSRTQTYLCNINKCVWMYINADIKNNKL